MYAYGPGWLTEKHTCFVLDRGTMQMSSRSKPAQAQHLRMRTRHCNIKCWCITLTAPVVTHHTQALAIPQRHDRTTAQTSLILFG
jgi:hypothetical protein